MGQSNDIKLTTWADEFGNWHALTEHTADREFAATCEREALRAIREEIGAREGKSYDPRTVGVRLRGEQTRGGVVVREFIETSAWIHDPSRDGAGCSFCGSFAKVNAECLCRECWEEEEEVAD